MDMNTWFKYDYNEKYACSVLKRIFNVFLKFVFFIVIVENLLVAILLFYLFFIVD